MPESPEREGGNAELAGGGGETVEIGELIVGTVGDGLEAEKADALVAGDEGDGGGFHIDHNGLVFCAWTALLFGVCDVVDGNKAMAFGLAGELGGGKALAGAVVDDFAGDA